MVIANGRKAMRGRRIAPVLYEHRTLMLPLAEAKLRHALWRRAFRALAWNVRIVPHEQLPAITCWPEFLPRFEPFGLAIADLRATSQTFADMLRHDDRTRLDSNATHAALPRLPAPRHLSAHAPPRPLAVVRTRTYSQASHSRRIPHADATFPTVQHRNPLEQRCVSYAQGHGARLAGPHIEYADKWDTPLIRNGGGSIMYVQTHKQGKRTQAFGAAAAVALTVGMGGLFTAMNFNAEKMERVSSELVFIEPPAPPVVEEIEPPPVVEEVEDTPAPPTPPPLVAPDIDFVPEELPVITAPVADPVPIPDPVLVTPAPAPIQSRSAPRLIASDKPAYPTASQRAGEQGTTQLDVCIAANGRVTSVKVARSSGHARLDDAAAKWIRGERFTPAKINGAARDVCGHSVIYEWNLRDA